MAYCGKPHYVIEDPDPVLSPFTGMTRTHWIDCGKYILGRAFEAHAHGFDVLLKFPKIAGKSYPQPGAPAWRHRAAELESIRRTSYLGVPLLHVDPDLTLNHIPVRAYYIHHLERLLQHDSPDRIPYPEELGGLSYQFTCELGGLSMQMLCFPDVLWPHFTPAQKDMFAHMVSKWGHYYTLGHNWRYFNVCMLTFLKVQGYAIDDKLLKAHLLQLLSLYSGDGWYDDGHFDYYSIYVLSLYGIIWARAYGHRHEPEIAEAIERNATALLQSYPALFGRNGFVPMWARSIIYRLSAIAGFPMAFLMKHRPDVDPGWARRISSGALVQFATRDDFYENDIPSLGYYGHREFCIQPYSSAGSTFTMFIPFVALALDEASPFWTATENEGHWATLGHHARVTEIPGPGMAAVQYGGTGAAELHTAKVADYDPNYSKLCYNTHFPWEDDDPAGACAMQYKLGLWPPGGPTGPGKVDPRVEQHFPARLFYVGLQGGVLYRQLVFVSAAPFGRGAVIDLAEIFLPQGMLRVDRCRMGREYELSLGHFGLPHLGGKEAVMARRTIRGAEAVTGAVPGRQLALVPLHGWHDVGWQTHAGRNAEADESTVIQARRRIAHYADMGVELLAALMLHKTDDTAWTDDELDPLASLRIRELMPSGSVAGAEVTLKTGEVYVVDFDAIDGRRRL